jgi:hypothetical protein
MKQWMGRIAMAAAIVGAIAAQDPGGTGGDGGTGGTGTRCPDQKAQEVPASKVSKGAVKTCGIGVVAFGLGGAIFGSECPEAKITYPAHQVCAGDALEGHKCVKEQDLKVKREECDCGGLVIPWIEIGIPAKCVCEEVEGGGHVEDFQTKEC